MTPQEKQDRREKIIERLVYDMKLDWMKIENAVLKVKADSISDLYLRTHPHNKDRVDAIVTSNVRGFLGYKK